MATTRSSTKRAAPDLAGDNFDAGAVLHSAKSLQLPGSTSRYTSAVSNNHEDPETGSHMITYPSRGSG